MGVKVEGEHVKVCEGVKVDVSTNVRMYWFTGGNLLNFLLFSK